MNVLPRWTRATALAAATAAVALATTAATAGAAPARTAATTSYTNTTFLQHALGLPASDTSPAIESVTYDRFQWLLQQPGRFAFLIGDPATDATFRDRAQDVEAAALAAGVKKVYWFNPNLSGSAKVGAVTEPALDIRSPSSIGLAAASQAKYDNAWKNVVGRYLGDGLSVTQVGALNSESATVSIAVDPTQVNDPGKTAGSSTKVGNTSGGALYDYTGGAAPANVLDSYFFVYSKDNTSGGQPAKIVAWTDLTAQASSASTQADVTTAIGTVGAANLTVLDQFAWWKSAGNAKQLQQEGGVSSGGNVPLLTDADDSAADGGWRVNQVTYPELVDLLKNADDASAVILFGGTWCPNTRPVLPFVNKYAQQNNVPVFNFDTVLDGGVVGGSTTSAGDPLQSRNTSNNGGTANANPTSLYGDVVSQYLTNIKTQYNPASTFVSYYPGGNTSGTLTNINKLQVPFVIGYQGQAGDAPYGGINRQWIIDKGDGTFTEYMSSWKWTNPQPNQLGLSIPLTAPVWSTINTQLASFTWQTDPTPFYVDTTTEADDAQFLVGTDTAAVSYGGSPTKKWTITSGGAVSISPAALSTALSALGGSAPANLAAAKTALLAAQAGSDATLTANLTTVVGAWGIAQSRKSAVNGAWGSATIPGSVAGGLNAVHALDVFYNGLPDVPAPPVDDTPVVAPDVTPPADTTPPAGVTPPVGVKVAAPAKVVRLKASKVKGGVTKAPTSKKAGKYKVTITAPKGASAPSGKVTVKLKKGKTTKKITGRLSRGTVTFSVPKLARGTWKVTISWPGDAKYLAALATGPSIKVTR